MRSKIKSLDMAISKKMINIISNVNNSYILNDYSNYMDNDENVFLKDDYDELISSLNRIEKEMSRLKDIESRYYDLKKRFDDLELNHDRLLERQKCSSYHKGDDIILNEYMLRDITDVIKEHLRNDTNFEDNY